MPHLHALFILKEKADKARISAHVDGVISAEIPDPITEPALYAAVKAHMIHGPCGHHNVKCPCMLNPKCPGTCFRSFPKRECKQTVADLDGYPEYRRRLTGPNVHTIPELGTHRDVDNSWVVPYNPYLLQKFDTHINVEISTSIKSFKYIFKYCYKGGDKAEIKLRMVNEDGTPQTYADLDELKHFADTRYISSHEALWRIFGFPTNALSHAVHRLSIHLPNEQNVVFTEENMERVLNEEPKDSTLIAYFNLCKGIAAGYDRADTELARDTLYYDIPKFFTWQADTRRWERRKQRLPDHPVMYWNTNKPVIGRIYDVSPKNLELFSLRLLLISRKGCACFEDLKYIPPSDDNEGYHCTSFFAAAKELGLIQDEEEWHLCLDEAAVYTMPKGLRFLFATVLSNCDIADPQSLWDRHCDQLIYPHRPDNPIPYSRNNNLHQAYMEVESIIQLNHPHLTLADYFHIRPPVPDEPNASAYEHDEMPSPVDLATLAAEAELMASKLNQEQRAAYDAIIHSILHQEGKAFFIDGPGGTGKSFLYNCITKKIYSMGLTLSACASTGIAATLIDGITIHKLMGVPMVLDFDSVSILRANSKAAGIIRDSACIIWDESPAGHRFILDLADRFLRDITRTDRPFGGKTFIAGGDWRQTLPVVPRGTNMEQIAACLRMSPLWPLFSANTFILTQNMRATNPLFADWLLDVGNGLTGPTINLKEQNIRIVTSAHALIQATFGSVLNPTTIHKIAHCAILSPTNKNTYIFNEEVLNMLEGPSSLRYSIDYPIVERANHP